MLTFSALNFLQSGAINYTALFALPVLLSSVLGPILLALGTAASVTLLLLADAWWSSLQVPGDSTARFLQAGLSGSGFFIIALLANQLALRLSREEKRARSSQSAARMQTQVNELVIDTLVDGVGVCRDFAHLMIAMCRALNIPARFTTAIDFGADPALGPTDFHAYVEVYVGHRWYMFDPSGTAIPMGFVRFATGRDAADAAFATMFGGVSSSAPVIRIEALPDTQGKLVLPQHVPEALSTAGADD